MPVSTGFASRLRAIGFVTASAVATLGVLVVAESGTARSATTSIPASQLAVYSVLSRDAAASDAIPAGTLQLQPGDSVIASRLVNPGSSVAPEEWLVETNSALCAYLASNGSGPYAVSSPGACASSSALSTNDGVVWFGSSSGPPRSQPETPASMGPTMYGGIAPDDVASVTVTFGDGTSQTAPVVSNAFEMAASGKRPTRVSYTTTSGVTYSLPGSAA